MSASEPFKSDSYQVGRIINAMSSDPDGNLIFSDIPNPDGVTLTKLLEGLISGNIKFNSEGTFFTGALNVEAALKQLNQFAYLNDTGRFIIVDSTISATKELDGSIYKYLNSAIEWVEKQVLNGYNTYNILLMGSHRSQGVLEQTTDIGVYEITPTKNITPLTIKNNGIKIIGIGNPVIRIKGFNGTTLERKNIFVIDSNTSENISVKIQDVSIEFVNCTYTSAFKIENAPIDTVNKARSGVTFDGVSVSFIGGTNNLNRLFDISSASPLISNIDIKNIKIGSIGGTTASSDEIQLIYVDHRKETVVKIHGLDFSYAEQPNPIENTDITNTVSATALYVENGKVIAHNIKLDEKFYWAGGLFSSTVTKLLKANNAAEVDMADVSIVRNAFNVSSENAGGITTIKDWIEHGENAIVNIEGFDSYLNLDVVSICSSGTSGTSGTPTSGTSGTSGSPDGLCTVKPIKSIWNNGKFNFGIGHKGDVRFGMLDNIDAAGFLNYDLSHGVPLWYNKDSKTFQYWEGTNIITLGSGGGGVGTKAKTVDVSSPEFIATSYAHGFVTVLGFEYTFAHNLLLSNKNAYSITIVDTLTGRKIEPQEVIAISVNSIKIILAEPQNVTVTIIGF